MKKSILLIFVLVLTIFSTVGCNFSVPQASSVLEYQIRSDKTKYDYGEEITIEFLFNISGSMEKDGNTYCVKIKESPYYEIIGENEIYTDGSENSEKHKGEYADYWYKAVFKIKVTEVYCGTHSPEIVVKRIGDDNWFNEVTSTGEMYYSGDPEYPFGRFEKQFEFTAVKDGVEFTELYSTQAPSTLLNFDILNVIWSYIVDFFPMICS